MNQYYQKMNPKTKKLCYDLIEGSRLDVFLCSSLSKSSELVLLSISKSTQLKDEVVLTCG